MEAGRPASECSNRTIKSFLVRAIRIENAAESADDGQALTTSASVSKRRSTRSERCCGDPCHRKVSLTETKNFESVEEDT